MLKLATTVVRFVLKAFVIPVLQMLVITHLEGVSVLHTGEEMTVQSIQVPVRRNATDAKVRQMVIAISVFPMHLAMLMASVCVM